MIDILITITRLATVSVNCDNVSVPPDLLVSSCGTAHSKPLLLAPPNVAVIGYAIEGALDP